jgi:capsular polysaccharide biosynthesis protein
MINLGPIGYLHKEDRKLIQSIIQSDHQKTKKIYVSRLNSSRSIPGERELEIELTKRDFIVLHAEELSYNEQVNMFSNAKLVVGPHGAGMVNAIYSGQEAHILEIMPRSRFNRCIEWQSAICGQTYDRIFYSVEDDKSELTKRILKFIDSYV